ncbi:MAG: Gfo/Idh/MocA family oxidoreductase [Parasporobacterium sp.]|nr:Gfo/Idh/MocA family oxidoreductase [Parasporobacterium sp.]
MIRTGMIGTNFISDWMLETVRTVGGMDITALCSRDMAHGKEYAQKHGIAKVYDSYQDMAEDPELDAVYIASPTMCHFDHAMLMLEHGKHVLCEKPVCSNLKELDMLISTAKEKGLVFMEAMKNVHQPGFKAVKNALKDIEPVRLASIAYCQYSSRYDNYKEGIIQNAFRSELSNGSVMDVGSYAAHFMAGLFGLPGTILSDSIKLSNGCDGAGMAICEYDDLLVHLMYSKITDAPLPSQIQGEKGSIIIDYCPNVSHVTVKHRKGDTVEMDFTDDCNYMKYEVRDFIRLVQDNDINHEYLEYSRIEMLVTDMIRKQNGIEFPADSRVVTD